MWYLFNKKNICFGTSDQAVNESDLASRNEFAVQSDTVHDDFTALRYAKGKIVVEKQSPAVK